MDGVQITPTRYVPPIFKPMEFKCPRMSVHEDETGTAHMDVSDTGEADHRVIKARMGAVPPHRFARYGDVLDVVVMPRRHLPLVDEHERATRDASVIVLEPSRRPSCVDPGAGHTRSHIPLGPAGTRNLGTNQSQVSLMSS